MDFASAGASESAARRSKAARAATRSPASSSSRTAFRHVLAPPAVTARGRPSGRAPTRDAVPGRRGHRARQVGEAAQGRCRLGRGTGIHERLFEQAPPVGRLAPTEQQLGPRVAGVRGAASAGVSAATTRARCGAGVSASWLDALGRSSGPPPRRAPTPAPRPPSSRRAAPGLPGRPPGSSGTTQRAPPEQQHTARVVETRAGRPGRAHSR